MKQFKIDMQEAFQKGAEVEFENLDEEILPESDIDKSLMKKGAAAYKAIVDGQMVGGAVVVIDESTQHNHLVLKCFIQSEYAQINFELFPATIEAITRQKVKFVVSVLSWGKA